MSGVWYSIKNMNEKKKTASKKAKKQIKKGKATKSMNEKKTKRQPKKRIRSDAQLYDALVRDEIDFTPEEWARIESWPKVADYDKGEGVRFDMYNDF
jgi:sRNA-binding protein